MNVKQLLALCNAAMERGYENMEVGFQDDGYDTARPRRIDSAQLKEYGDTGRVVLALGKGRDIEGVDRPLRTITEFAMDYNNGYGSYRITEFGPPIHVCVSTLV